MQYDEIQEVLKKLSIFDKLYEQVRFVDPVAMKVLNITNDEMIQSESRCYAFWGRNRACENCISMHAWNENKSFVKIEYTNDNYYMVTAVPFELSDRRIVIELLKDVTDSIFFEVNEGENVVKAELRSMIDRLNSIAMKDSLTGMYNKRYLNEKLPVDLLNAALLDQHLSIILTDIDFFKKVNDTFGHLVGDCALKIFAERLDGCLQREGDWIARFGGEEFLICLPGVDQEKAIQVAELMRRIIEEGEFKCGEKSFQLTASFGIYSGKPGRGERAESLIKYADDRLYEAKKNGRNRVE